MICDMCQVREGMPCETDADLHLCGRCRETWEEIEEIWEEDRPGYWCQGCAAIVYEVTDGRLGGVPTSCYACDACGGPIDAD